MKMARASSRPRWTSAFFVSSSSVAACFFRDPALISAFSWSYLLSSSTISLNSSSEITPSMRARETWSEIVFSLLAAKTRISQCFLILTARRRPTIFPAAPAIPQSKAVASRPITTGAAIIVFKRPTPPTPVNALIKRRVVSQPFKIFEARRYFFFQLRPFLPFGF